jgi:hypothetical protein
LALALGVGHKRSSSVRFPPLDRVPEQARGVGQLVPLADCKDEEPLAPVGRADFRRCEEACRKAVAHADQSCGDFGEAEAEMMGDILEEDEGRLDLGDDAGDMRPQVTRVVRAPPLARDGERLARIARSDDIHRAAPRAAVKGDNVVPDWRVVEAAVAHSGAEDGCREGVPFDKADGSGRWQSDLEAEVEPARAATQAEHVHVGNSRTSQSPDCSCGKAAGTRPESPAGSPDAAELSAMSPSSGAAFRRRSDDPAQEIPASSRRSSRISRHRPGSLRPSVSLGTAGPSFAAAPDAGADTRGSARSGTGGTRTASPDAGVIARPHSLPSGVCRRSSKGRRGTSTCP